MIECDGGQIGGCVHTQIGLSDVTDGFDDTWGWTCYLETGNWRCNLIFDTKKLLGICYCNIKNNYTVRKI